MCPSAQQQTLSEACFSVPHLPHTTWRRGRSRAHHPWAGRQSQGLHACCPGAELGPAGEMSRLGLSPCSGRSPCRRAAAALPAGAGYRPSGRGNPRRRMQVGGVGSEAVAGAAVRRKKGRRQDQNVGQMCKWGTPPLPGLFPPAPNYAKFQSLQCFTSPLYKYNLQRSAFSDCSKWNYIHHIKGENTSPD